MRSTRLAIVLSALSIVALTVIGCPTSFDPAAQAETQEAVRDAEPDHPPPDEADAGTGDNADSGDENLDARPRPRSTQDAATRPHPDAGSGRPDAVAPPSTDGGDLPPDAAPVAADAGEHHGDGDDDHEHGHGGHGHH